MTTQFAAGKTYSTRSIGDYDCVIAVTITRRTAQTVSALVRGKMKTFRITVLDGVESIMPWGRYSMAPMIDANDLH